MTSADPSDFDELLDLGLATAFRTGADADEVPATPNVEVERVDDLPTRIGRYEMRGLIAQGGMGVIVRAHDADLGREVAIKLLRRRLVEVATLQRMFQQEARVMGQLQHPGIVPVHDVGITSDGRPYYAMKLVGGESLQTMLRAGASPPERQKLLGVFLRICETVAYAHSRGVVHGDLTPSNVMVGAFGEVQVLDWGFSRGSHAVADDSPGAPRVLGTPAYMAPEQARGGGDRLDPRVDVFGLGGILCALLTGEPPYRGGNRDEVYLRATRAWLDDAQGRLDRCGAAAELIEIVRACIAVDPAQRPADAGAVATLLRDHLAAVEQRVQAHALEAAQAHARADAERKARWRTAWLSGLVLACAVVGVGIWLWAERREHAVRVDAEQRATALIHRMVSLRDSARAASVERGQRWSETVAVAREARDVFDAHYLDETVRVRLDALRAEIELEAQQALRDERAARLLEDLDPHIGEDRTPDEMAANYRSLFAVYGVDIDTMAPELAVAPLRDSLVLDHLIEALHRWARHRRHGGADTAAWRRPILVADALDRDAWRTELRRVWCERDLVALQRMADACDHGKVSSESSAFLAACLVEFGDRARGLQVYRQAYLHHPGEYEIVHDLAAELQRDAEPNHAEITGLMRAALALRPNSAHALIDLASELMHENRIAEARKLADRALASDPNYARGYVVLGTAADLAGDLAGMEQAITTAANLRPNWVTAHLLLADCLHRNGKFVDALAVCRKLAERVPKSARAARALGTVQTELGFIADALANLRRALDLAPNDPEAHYHLGLALQAAGMDAMAVDAYRRAGELSPEYAEAFCNLGNALLQLGRFSEAVDALRKGHSLGQARPKWRHPSERWVEAAETMLMSAPMIEEAAAGGSRPGSPHDLGGMAVAVLQSGRPREALALFREVDAMATTGLAPFIRFAVSAAARAAVDPACPDAERAAAWRDCRTWIEGSLDAMRASFDQQKLSKIGARLMLARWQLCPELQPARDQAADADGDWRRVWQRVDAMQALLRDAD